MHPSEGALLPLLAHVEPPALPGVLDRVRALVGDDRFGEALRAERPHPDPFVGALARHLPPHLLVDLAADPCLTPAQLTAVIEAHGGNAVVRATFHDSPDDTEPPRTEGPAADLDAARARIRADGCDAATAAALLRAHPVLAWTGRDPALARVLHGPDHVFDSAVGTRRPLLRALLTGAVTLGDLTERIRPAQLCVQWFAWVWREESREVPRPAVAACLRDHVGRALGTDPRAWAAFARLLGRHRGTLADLAADAAADAVAEAAPAGPGEPRIVVAKGARPAFGFLLRTMDIAVKAALLDHLDDEFAAGALVPGDVQPDPEVLDLALTRRHHALLAAFARHQYLGEARGRRIAALDDRALDLVLVANQAGVGAALRREIVAGTAHGTDRPREPLDDDLRLWAIAAATPGTGTGYVVDRVAFALSGDPALVTLGLPRCGRLRRVDQYDVLLSLWERAGPGAVTAVVTSLSAAERDEALAAPVQAKLASALAAGDPEVLRAERARIAARRVTRRTEGARAPDPWQLPPEERLRDHALDSSAPHWLPEHVAGGRVPGTDLVRYGRPAAIALGVAEGVYRRPLADAGLRDALAGVAARIGPRPEAWAVFVQLLPDFTGTLAELADLAAVAAG